MPTGSRSSLLRYLVPLVVAVVLVVVAVVAFQRGVASVPAADRSTMPAQPVDTGFAADMFEHHQQALQMALLAINGDVSSAVRTMAVEIITSQQRESGQLMQFLADRGQAVPSDPDRTVMAWMGEPMPRAQMPGLASTDELTSLTNASGTEFERQFLTLMVRHHEGGVHMAEVAQQRAESELIRDLAGRMLRAQRREINEMQQLLGPSG